MTTVFQRNWHRRTLNIKRKHVVEVVQTVIVEVLRRRRCISLFCGDRCANREREHPPRFARPGTFEFEYSKRWKSLDEMEKLQREQVEKNMREAREKLESEMDDAYHEHQANMLRQGKFLTLPLLEYPYL